MKINHCKSRLCAFILYPSFDINPDNIQNSTYHDFSPYLVSTTSTCAYQRKTVHAVHAVHRKVVHKYAYSLKEGSTSGTYGTELGSKPWGAVVAH
jgi:hypothetical protein